MVAVNSKVGDIANFMQRYVLDRPVIDQSGLDGKYDIRPTRAVEPPDLFTASSSSLG